jgi:hypothetical protein
MLEDLTGEGYEVINFKDLAREPYRNRLRSQQFPVFIPRRQDRLLQRIGTSRAHR